MANEVDFFTKRREMIVGDFHSFKESEAIRMVRAPMKIPLANRRPTSGIPEWVLKGYEVVVEDDGPYGKMVVRKGRKIEGMTMSFFTTDTVKGKMNAGVKDAISGLGGCSMEKFRIERVGEDDKAEIYFCFELRAPCNPAIILWFYGMQGATVYVEFDATQAAFHYAGEKKEDEDEDTGQENLFPKPEGSGPKLVKDPNDNPSDPLPNDTRKVTKPTDKPGDPKAKRSHHAKKSAN
jgi:hypothetical protein